MAESKRAYGNLELVRAGIIGYGGAFNMGRRHGQSMELTGKMKVTAVCDKDPSREAVAKGDFADAKFYTDMDQMLGQEDLDLCVVILPHNLHAPVCIQCAEAGKHVVTEKPMSISDAEAVAMIEAADRGKVMLSVFHNRRWDGDFMTLRDLVVDQQIIGEVFHVEMFGGRMGRPREWWRSYKEYSGGLFFDWGAHYLDWLLQLMPGKITGVTGFFHKLKWHEFSNEDDVKAVIRWENGAMAMVHWTSLGMLPKERWRLLGTEGSIASGDGKFKVNVDLKGHEASFEVKYQDSNWDGYYANVAEHLTAGAELLVTAAQARRVIAIMDVAEKSSRSGRTEPLPTE